MPKPVIYYHYMRDNGGFTNDDFSKLWGELPKDVREKLLEAVGASDAAAVEEFLSEMFIGDCPDCGSRATGDCAREPDIKDVTVGICRDCGYLWCTECGRPVTWELPCEHWAICEKCPEADGSGDCGLFAWECEKVSVSDKSKDAESSHKCAWCARDIRPGADVYGVGAKARKDVSLEKHEGTILEMGLAHNVRTLPAMIVSRGSEAKKAGNDIMFMVCSKECGEALKKALRKERFSVV
jgi:hypothetical protein